MKRIYLLSVLVLLTATCMADFSFAGLIDIPGPVNVPSKHNKAIQFLKESKFNEVINFEKNILKETPKDLNAFFILNLAYLGKGQERETQGLIKRVKKIDPLFVAEMYTGIGRFYLSKKRFYKALVYLRKSLSIRDDPDVTHQLAVMHMGRGQIKRAKSYFEKLLQSKPDYINLARIHLLEEDYKNAILYAKKGAQKKEYQLNGYIILGSSYLQTGEYNLAREYYLKIKKLAPKYSLADYNLGLISLIWKDYDEALRIFTGITKKLPNIKESHLNSAVIHHLRGDLKKAEKAALLAIKSEPNDFLGHIALGTIYISGSQSGKADLEFKKAGQLFYNFKLPGFKTVNYFNSDLSVMPASFTLSNIFYREGLVNLVIKIVDERLKDATVENPFLLLTKARAEIKLGHIKKAKDIYLRVTKKNPEIVSSFIELGDIAIHKSDSKQAILFYKKGVKLAPDSWKTHLELGNFYYRAGNLTEAVNEYEKVISLLPKSPVGYNQLAWIMAEKMKKYNKAISYAKKGAALNTENMNIKDTLGWIYYQSGQYDKALQTYSEILTAKIKNPTVYYHVGMVYEKLKKNDKAIHAFENALNISDEFPEATETIKKLKVLSRF